MKKKVLTTLMCVALMLGCFFLAGCSGGEDKDNPAAGENTLVYGSQDYTAINPALYEHGEINMLLFAGLTAHDAENQVVPGLAEDCPP